MQLLSHRFDAGLHLCVGLDSAHECLPLSLEPLDVSSPGKGQLEFNRRIVEATKDLVAAYKPNLAFYPGPAGKTAMVETIRFIHDVAPEIPVILDAKQADIGSTNRGYVLDDFEFYGADAVTVHPYLGAEAMKPFLDRADKGIIVLCRTSNPGAGEFQDLLVHEHERTWRLYHVVAHRVATSWNYNGNCAVVVGGTYPKELGEIRQIIGDMPILIPGIGAQGGEIEAAVKAGVDGRGRGIIANSARGIIFASSGRDFAVAARAAAQSLHDQIATVVATIRGD